MPKQELSSDIKEKFKEMKAKLDKFKKEVLKKFDKYIIGISLLPPKEEKEKKKLSTLVLVDDSETKQMSKYELIKKLESAISSIAKTVDPQIKPDVMLLSELREVCYDAKWDILKAVSSSAAIYDPTDLFAALKIAEVHKEMVIKKFEKYILSYIAAGSLFRGEKSHDIDVYIVIDDTDVKKMSRIELKDKLRAIITSMGFEAKSITGVDKVFHVQTYILTDFWENVKDANPVIFTFLRDGVPLFDRGVFMPWKLLLKMGRIKPSPEAIDMHMSIGEGLINRLKSKMLGIVGEDLYYAALNPAQATLMLYGIPPTTPKETIKLMDQIFVKKEHLLEQKYVKILEKIRKAYKDIEHGKIKIISGKEIDDLLKNVEDYLNRIHQLFNEVQKRVEGKQVLEIHDTCLTIVKDLLASENIKKDPVPGLAELVKLGKIPENFLNVLKSVIKAKNDFKAKKLSKQEADKIRKEASSFIRTVVEYIQRKKGLELERSKIRIKYNDKLAEVYLFANEAFIIPNLKNKAEVQKAQLNKDGSLYNIKAAEQVELEKAIVEFKADHKTAITQKTIDSLGKIFGKDMEILLSY